MAQPSNAAAPLYVTVEDSAGHVKSVTHPDPAAVQASEQGTRVVDHGLTLTTRAGEGIRSLTDTIRDASRAAEEIATSAHQQSVGMDQIAESMSEIESGTTQFLDGAQQSQRAAENLNQLSAKLASLTERYRV